MGDRYQVTCSKLHAEIKITQSSVSNYWYSAIVHVEDQCELLKFPSYFYSRHKHILNVMDEYCGWTNTPDIHSQAVATILVEQYHVALCAITQCYLRWAKFCGQQFLTVIKKYNTKHFCTSPHRPQGNGSKERQHMIFNYIISKLVNRDLIAWDKYLSTAVVEIWMYRIITIFLVVQQTFSTSHWRILKTSKGVFTLKQIPSNTSMHQHKAVFYVVKQMNREKEKRMGRRNENVNSKDFKIGGYVFFLKHQLLSKHDRKWKEGYYIIKKLSPVTSSFSSSSTSGFRADKAH